MTNRQVIVILILGVLAACTLCVCVGLLVIVTEPAETGPGLTETVPTEQATETSMPTNTATPEPVEATPTVRPTNTSTVAPPAEQSPNLAYRDCVLPLLDEALLLTAGIRASSAVGETDPLGFCDDWYPRGLLEKARRLWQAHLQCPIPTDTCVLQTREYMDVAFSELADGCEYFNRYCDAGDLLNSTYVELAVEAMTGALSYSTLAAEQMSTCIY